MTDGTAVANVQAGVWKLHKPGRDREIRTATYLYFTLTDLACTHVHIEHWIASRCTYGSYECNAVHSVQILSVWSQC